MSTFDLAIVAFYLLVMVALGLAVQKKGSEGIDSYFLGNRRVPWWLLGCSGMASNFDITGTMINTALVFVLGISGFFLEIRGGIGLFLAFMMVLMGKWNRRSRVMTFAEWMRLRFGTGWQGNLAQIIAAIGMIFVTIAMVTYFSTGAGLFVANVLGVPPALGLPGQFWAALLMIVLAMVYTVTSGLYGVLVTDFFQGVVIFVAVGYLVTVTVTEFVLPEVFTVSVPLSTKNLSAQITNAEWLLSIPGTERQKATLLGCAGCHTYERIVKSTHDPEGFVEVLERMGHYYPGSIPTKPQRLSGTASRMARTRGDAAVEIAEWLSTINLSQTETRQYELRTLPRLTGESTKVIITEYDLPNDLIQPHDVILDEEGTVWYSDFGQMFLGKMDPHTGEVTQYPIPVLKEGWPVGTLDLEADQQGNIWVGVMYQANIAMFDPKTEQFRQWSVPDEWQTDAAQTGHLAVGATHVDGKVWIKNSDQAKIYRLDLNCI